MKAFRIFLVLAFAFAALGLMPQAVHAQKFSAYTSGINIQNLGATTATIQLQFYSKGAENGTGSTTPVVVNGSIDAFSVKSYFPLPDVSAGFNGSVVVSSSQPVAAVANIGSSDLKSMGAYDGATTGATSIFLPLLQYHNGGFDSNFSVQNAGSSTADVHIAYSDGVVKDIKVAAKNSVTINQATENHPAKGAISASVSSTNAQPLVVVVLQENGTSTTPGNEMVYTGFTSASKTPVMPTVNVNNGGYSTGIQVYNQGSAETSVTISYTPAGNGTACTETQTIPATSSKTFALGAFSSSTSGENCVNGEKFVGSAKVTNNSANQDLSVVVNQLKLANLTNGSAYSAFDPGAATNTIFMPTIMDRNSKWYTAFNLMNVGGASTWVRCTYAGQTHTDDFQLASDTSKTVTNNNSIAVAPAVSYVGSAVCKAYTDNTFTTADPAGKIVSVVNQLGPGGPDNLMTYEGINPQVP